MISNLSVQNFKSWQSIDDMELGKITGLFGSNSSGKTSILQLLLLLKQTAESSDRAQVLDFGGKKGHVDLGSPKDIIFKHDLSKNLTFQISWGLPDDLAIYDPTLSKKVALFKGNYLSLFCNIETDKNVAMHAREISYFFSGTWFSIYNNFEKSDKYTLEANSLEADGSKFSFKRAVGRAWPLPPPIKCYGFPDQVKAYYQNADFLSDFELAFENLFSKVFYLGPLREYPRRQYTWAGGRPADVGPSGERVVDALLASRNRKEKISPGFKKRKLLLEEYVAKWLVKLGLVSSFSIEEIAKDSNIYQAVVKTHQWGSSVTITDVGFGVSQVLPVLVVCYYVPEGSTIIMEQPEIHLHPSVQAGLADVFIDAVKNRDIQIILESHSEHLLRRLQRRIAEEEIVPEDAKLYFCNVERGASELQRLEIDEYGHIKNWPTNFFGDVFGEVAATTQAKLSRVR